MGSSASSTQITRSHVPNLESHCNSWVLTRKADNQVIGEFYNRHNVELFDPAKVLIETAAQYLSRLNGQIVLASQLSAITEHAQANH